MIGTLAMHVSAADVAPELKAARARVGLSQQGMATTLGVSRRTISRWESGRGTLHKIYLTHIRALRDNAAKLNEEVTVNARPNDASV